MSDDPLATSSREATWQIKKQNFFFSTTLIVTKHGRVVTYVEEAHPWCHMTLWLPGHKRPLDNFKTRYFLFCKVHGHQTWHGSGLWSGNSSMISHDPLIMLSRGVTWQIKSLISPIAQDLWTLNLRGWWLTMRGTNPWRHMTLWTRVHVSLCDKLKA